MFLLLFRFTGRTTESEEDRGGTIRFGDSDITFGSLLGFSPEVSKKGDWNSRSSILLILAYFVSCDVVSGVLGGRTSCVSPSLTGLIDLLDSSLRLFERVTLDLLSFRSGSCL